MSKTLNTAVLEELKMIMEDEFSSLLETFLEESAKQFAEVQNAWAEQDMDQLRRSAHTLKGSCGNIGAETLQGTCQHLESSAHQGVADGIPELIDVAAVQLEEVNGAINAL